MKANTGFNNKSLDFWANIKLISQQVGYTDKKTSKVKVPTLQSIEDAFRSLHISPDKLLKNDDWTEYGREIIRYFEYRAYFLNDCVEPNLMDKLKAEQLFHKLKSAYNPRCVIPMNKQKGDKKAPLFFTGIINILIEANLAGRICDFDPKSFTLFTQENYPARSLSRRVDGAFPSIVNPVAIWEIKEYYYTTTFGSRVADGVYETLLDGYELSEVRKFTGKDIHHYLMIDDYFTWWTLGRSYLCRICDMLHAGLVTEVLFGKEVVERIPAIVQEWIVQTE
jgi:hypothetical protein